MFLNQIHRNYYISAEAHVYRQGTLARAPNQIYPSSNKEYLALCAHFRIRARVFKSRQLPVSGRSVSFPHSFHSLFSCLFLFLSIREATRMETRSLSPGARDGRFRGESHD